VEEDARRRDQFGEAFADECCLERHELAFCIRRGGRQSRKETIEGRHTSKILTRVSSTKKASNNKATKICPSPRTRKTALNHPVGP
jgi:hypothetical protein